MTELSTDELKQAVESQHGGTATLAQIVPIREMRGEQLVWQGTIHVFDVAGHPDAIRVYAWSCEMPDGKRRVFVLPHLGTVTGPREAIRAAIAGRQMAAK